MKLKPGTKLVLEISPCDYGLKLEQLLAVGRSTRKRKGKPILVRSEEELWIELEQLAQRKLARLGLEKSKP